jgi:HSP20 family molecular chaperone IbpA
MVSFLRRLRGEGIAKDGSDAAPAEAAKGVVQLDVDVFQSDKDIVIFAPVAGADTESIDISIEGDNDVVTIHGTRNRPEKAAFGHAAAPEGHYFSEEAVWGEFFRQIILPEAVDVSRAEAKLKAGVLILSLPLLRQVERAKVKMKVTNLDHSHSAS